MHKVDSSGATAQNEFTNGNSATQTPRTRLESKWMNSVQRELVRLVEARGGTLNDADDSQLSKGIVLWLDGGAAAIRALPIPATGIVTILERSLGRVYSWNSASAAADDGGTVIRPSSNPTNGRWVRSQLNENLIGSYSWARLSGVPASFPPSPHSHSAADISRTILEGRNIGLVSLPVTVQTTVVEFAAITVSTSSIIHFTANCAISKSGAGTAGSTFVLVEFVDVTGQVRLLDGRNYARVISADQQPGATIDVVVSGFARGALAGTVTPRLSAISYGGDGAVAADQGRLSLLAL